MAKSIEDLIVRLKAEGFENIDKLRGSFRDLGKVTNATEAQLSRTRKELLDFAKQAGDTQRVNKGLEEGLKGLLGEAQRSSSVWKQLVGDLAKVRQEARLTDSEVTTLRDAIVKEAQSHTQSAASIREHVKSLQDLRNQASLNGKVHQQLGADIQKLTARLEEGVVTNKKHYSSLTQILAVKPDTVLKQWEAYNRILQEGTASADKLATAQRRLNQLSGAPRILERRKVISSAEITQDPEYLKRFGFEGRSLPELPNTNAAYAQQIKELQQDLAHLNRTSIEYLQTQMQLAGVQRQATEVTRGFAQSLVMGLDTRTVERSQRNLQEALTALRAEMQQLDTTTTEGAQAYASNANSARRLEQQLRDLGSAYRHVGDMAVQAATAEQNAANARIRNNYLNRSAIVAQEQALADLGRRVREGVAGTPLMLPAAGQTSAPGTGLAISGGANVRFGGRASVTYRTPGAEGVVPRYGVQPGGGVERFFGRGEPGWASGTVPIGPAMTPEQDIKNRTRVITETGQAYDAFGKSVERARRPLRDIYVDIDKTTKASNGSINSLDAQIAVWTELRNAVGKTAPAFDTATKKLEQLTTQRDRLSGRRRLTAGQAVQAGGAIISGGIFGGPEGFLGGLGGAALGSVVPGLGTVGGAFAGSAIGAQVGMFRQQLGAAASYAAEIRRLQLALQGVVTSFDDYRASLQAIKSASEQFNIPVLESTQQFTKLTAAVVGSGGTVKEAESTFKGLAASVLATGGSVEDINGALVAASQVFSKGKVSAEELRGQIGERLAGAFALFAESGGKSTQQLDASLKSGEVSLSDFVKFTEFSLKKYGRTAQLIADSPEQAGARLDRALKNLQQNVGDALGPTGAAFQDFASRSIRGLDRLINKLIELKAIQPGSGYYEQQVLGGQLSVGQLESELLRAGQKETSLRRGAESVGLGFIANLLPEIRDANKEAAILEQALIKIRLREKETNKDRKQRLDDEQKAEKEKLGQSYLQAFDQRAEALAKARQDREETIAAIRKKAAENLLALERTLGDERRRIEYDIQNLRRKATATGEDINLLRRLQAGEDPRRIEAERKLLGIYRQSEEDRAQAEQQFNEEELEQARTIADYQKSIAKEIAAANETYNKRIGEAQKEFAKASAKIIEEGSGKAARRLETAGKILGLYLQRAEANIRVASATGGLTVAEPGRGPHAGSLPAGMLLKQPGIDINTKILIERFIKWDKEINDLQKNLQSRGPAGAGATANRFMAAFAGQGSLFEDVAGLQPLPIKRMQRQAARPLLMFWEGAITEAQRLFGSATRRNDAVIQRTQRMEAVRRGWDPLSAQWQENVNRMNPNPRSKPAVGTASSLRDIINMIYDNLHQTVRRAGGLAVGRHESYGSLLDFSEYLSDKQLKVITDGLKSTLDRAYVRSIMLGGDKGAFDAATSKLLPIFYKFRRAITDALVLEASKGHRYATKALKQFGSTGNVPGGGTWEDYYSRSRYMDEGIQNKLERMRLDMDRLMEPPYIIPGVQKDFEGASLRSRRYPDIASISSDTYSLLAGLNIGDEVPFRQPPAAGATSGARQQRREQQDININETQRKEIIDFFVQTTEASRTLRQNLEDQNYELSVQAKYLRSDINPELQRQLVNAEVTYKQDLDAAERNRDKALELGKNQELVTEQYNNQITSAMELYAANVDLINQGEVRRKQLEDMSKEFGPKFSASLQQYYDSVTDLGTQIGGVVQSTFQGLEDQLTNFVTTGKVNFTDLANSILADMARIAIRQGIIAPLLKGIGSLFPGLNLKFNANGAAYAANGIVPFAMGGIVSRPTFFTYANGGVPGTGLMGEAGPEAIMPLRRLPSGKLGVEAAGGGGITVNVSVDATGTQVQGNAGAGNQLGRAVAAAVQQELIKQKRPGGLLVS